MASSNKGWIESCTDSLERDGTLAGVTAEQIKEACKMATKKNEKFPTGNSGSGIMQKARYIESDARKLLLDQQRNMA